MSTNFNHLYLACRAVGTQNLQYLSSTIKTTITVYRELFYSPVKICEIFHVINMEAVLAMLGL